MTGRVVVRFADDEILEGTAADIDLDRPAFRFVVDDPGTNSRTALVPLTSVKRITVGRRPCALAPEALPKVVLRFRDGEVLPGLLVDGPHPKAHGVLVDLADCEARQVETMIVAYDNLKAVFYLEDWQSRPAEFLDVTGRWSERRPLAPLVELLGEIRRLGRLRDRGHISGEEYERRRQAILARI